MTNYARYTIGDLRFICTCSMCPEQYDVVDREGKQVGYVRLRGGYFRVDCPECLEETVYQDNSFGDLVGSFETENQRIDYLNRAAYHINEWRSNV